MVRIPSQLAACQASNRSLRSGGVPIRRFVLGCLVLLVASGCRPAGLAPAAGSPDDTAAPEAYLTPIGALEPAGDRRVRVVATTTIVGNLVASVGQQRIELDLLMPPGVDPHAFQLTPRDLANLSEADVLFVNGLGLEQPFLDDLALGELSPPIVSLSEGIQPRRLGDTEPEHAEYSGEHEGEEPEKHEGEEPEEHEGEEHQAEEHDEHDHAGIDPHVWFDPTQVIVWVQNLEQALTALDPQGAALYQRNAADLVAELEQLDRWIESQIASLPADNRKIVTDHDALGYFADRYGLEIVGAVIPAYSTLAEPSARQLAELEDTISALGVRAVFVGFGVNPALAARVARDLGVQLVPIYDGSLSEPGGPASSYLDFMRYNVNAIVEALR